MSERGGAEVVLQKGWVEPALGQEFPGLGLCYAVVEGRPGRSVREVKRRLRYLSDRMHGLRALNLRQEPIPSAYRVFFRHIGLDPDEFRTPIEAAVVERLRAGGFASRSLVDDALTIATVETGVALLALDASRTVGRLGLRIAHAGERLGGESHGSELPEGALVVADEQAALSLIFGEIAPGRGVRPGTRQLAFCAIQVQGVPEISVDEAVWTCVSVFLGAGDGC